MAQLLIMDLPEEHAELVKDMLVDLMKTVETCNQEKGKTEENLAECFLVKSIHLMADSARMVDLDREALIAVAIKARWKHNILGYAPRFREWKVFRPSRLWFKAKSAVAPAVDAILAHMKGD